MDLNVIFELVLAANYLDIKPLLDLTCKHIAGITQGKTPEDFRNYMGIEGDLTPEEEEHYR